MKNQTKMEDLITMHQRLFLAFDKLLARPHDPALTEYYKAQRIRHQQLYQKYGGQMDSLHKLKNNDKS